MNHNGKQEGGIRLLKTEKPFRKEYADIRRNYLDPFFGEIKPNELTPTLIEQYIESRWGRNKDGNLQAMERTLKTEMMVLRQLVESVDENFNFHKRLLKDLKYVSLYRDLLQPLTSKQNLSSKIQLLWHIFTLKRLSYGIRFKTMLSMTKSWASFS